MNKTLYACGLESHPRWIYMGDYSLCSNCGENSGTQYDGVEPVPRETKYCPHCGSEMIMSHMR